MVLKDRKSKRRSASSSPSPPERLVFFTDASLGRRVVPDALRAAGEDVKVHAELFSPGMADRVWLRVAGEERRILLTKDSKIRYHRSEIVEFLSAGVRAFVLVSNNLPGSEMGKIFVKALPRIKKLCEIRPAPFIAHVHKDGAVALMRTHRQRGA